MLRKFIGKTFLNPIIDYLLIGGLLSILVIPAAATVPTESMLPMVFLPLIMLVSNSAHFAASTVRLYSRENSFQDFPLLTMLLPLVTVVVLSAAIIYPENLGANLQALYLTWSPYHYARQAYGLSVMYCYRSGCEMSPRTKQLFLIANLLPFFLVITTTQNSGLLWIVPLERLSGYSAIYLALFGLTKLLPILSFALPILIFLWLARSSREHPMPIISLLIVLTNAAWWILFDYRAAFVWATVFHGLQYLSIMLIFHVRDRMKVPGNTMRPIYHALSFYGCSVALGYFLFQCWPYFYIWAGFGMAESMLLVIAVINIHHFIVDGYIWRLKRDPNYQIVISDPALPQPA